MRRGIGKFLRHRDKEKPERYVNCNVLKKYINVLNDMKLSGYTTKFEEMQVEYVKEHLKKRYTDKCSGVF